MYTIQNVLNGFKWCEIKPYIPDILTDAEDGQSEIMTSYPFKNQNTVEQKTKEEKECMKVMKQ